MNSRTTHFNPVISYQQAADIDAQAFVCGAERRCALAILTCSSQQLIDDFGASPETLIEMISHAKSYEHHTRALHDLAETTVSRLIAVAAAILERGQVA